MLSQGEYVVDANLVFCSACVIQVFIQAEQLCCYFQLPDENNHISDCLDCIPSGA